MPANFITQEQREGNKRVSFGFMKKEVRMRTSISTVSGKSDANFWLVFFCKEQ